MFFIFGRDAAPWLLVPQTPFGWQKSFCLIAKGELAPLSLHRCAAWGTATVAVNTTECVHLLLVVLVCGL